MDAGNVIPEAIQALLEKRTTFQDWLSRLDELGSDFRAEVAEKVRSDYEDRLTGVEGELEGHRTELESVLAERSRSADRIAGEHDVLSAELEETELRHAVGEFDDEEWELRRGDQQARIDELDAELTEQRSAVGSLQAVLGELTGAAAAVEAIAESEAPEVEPEAEGHETAEDLSAEAETEVAPEGWMTQPFDEDELGAELVEPDVVGLELVDSELVDAEFVDAEFVDAEIVGAEVESAEVEAAEEPEADAAEPAVDPGEPAEFMDELEFLESLSLDDADNFDAVSAMLDEDDGDSGADSGSERKTEDS